MKKSRRASAALTGAMVAAVVAAVGCATTQQAELGTQAARQSCAFLGRAVCAELRAPDASSERGVARLRYVDPRAQWTRYREIMVAPVTFWAGDDTKLSPEDQHRLVDYFHQTLEQQLATRFRLAQQPGPGVMTLQVALVDAKGATPVLRTISMIVPQARVLASLKYLATGSYAFVGGATAEAKVLDSLTHQVLAAAVDRRIGGGSLETAAQWQWGDAENAMNAWAEQLTGRLAAWTSGAPVR